IPRFMAVQSFKPCCATTTAKCPRISPSTSSIRPLKARVGDGGRGDCVGFWKNVMLRHWRDRYFASSIFLTTPDAFTTQAFNCHPSSIDLVWPDQGLPEGLSSLS